MNDLRIMTGTGVDVVMPLFNKAPYVAQAVCSVLAQTPPPASLTVVDDGSTDNSAAVVSDLFTAYAGPVHTRLVRQTNKGPNAARNVGVRHGNAPLIAFLDADDEWLPHKLARQSERINNDPSVQLVHCGALAVDQYGTPLQRTSMGATPPLTGPAFPRLLVVNSIEGSASAVMMRRETFERVNGFDESLRGMEDWDMWLRASHSGTIEHINDILVKIRTFEGNTQSDRQFMITQFIAFIQKWYPIAASMPEAMHYWGHLLGELVLHSSDTGKAKRTVQQGLTLEQRRRIFARTKGSFATYLFLKRLRKVLSR